MIFKILFTVLSLAIISLSLVKSRVGATINVFYMFLAPYLLIGNTFLGTRVTALVFLMIYLLKYHKDLGFTELSPLKPFFFLLLSQFVFVILSDSFSASLRSWLMDMAGLCFPMLLLAIMRTDEKAFDSFSKGLVLIFVVIITYGLFLTQMPGVNPYLILTQSMFGSEFNEAYAAGNSGLSSSTELNDARLFGRISSFFGHPMNYAISLGFFAIFCVYYLRGRTKTLLFVEAATVIAIFVSGTRTPIAAIFATITFVLLYQHKFRYFVYAAIAALVIIYGLPLISTTANDYLMSIFSTDNEIQGSSVSMRLDQMEGCFNIVADSLIFGKGYDWTGAYNAVYGQHPVALYFESIVFYILCNTGILGFFIWGYFVYLYYKLVEKLNDKTLKLVLLSMLVYFLVFTLITGLFGLKYFILFYTLSIGSIYATNCKEKN